MAVILTAWYRVAIPSVVAAPANCWLKLEPEVATTPAEPSCRCLSWLSHHIFFAPHPCPSCVRQVHLVPLSPFQCMYVPLYWTILTTINLFSTSHPQHCSHTHHMPPHCRQYTKRKHLNHIPTCPPSHFVSSPQWPASFWCPNKSCLLASPLTA